MPYVYCNDVNFIEKRYCFIFKNLIKCIIYFKISKIIDSNIILIFHDVGIYIIAQKKCKINSGTTIKRDVFCMFREILGKYGVEFVGAVPFSVCRVFAEDIITRRGVGVSDIASAILFLVPYYYAEKEESNISVYARAQDYHFFFEKLYAQIIPELEKHYGARFFGFADKSAINEVHAASCAGLGMIGDNGLIINEKYGSFVFIGEILTDLGTDELGYDVQTSFAPSFCEHCHACRRACPMNDGVGCLSFVTQKKGELSEEEIALIKKYGSAWGCDICSEVCPHTKKAISEGNVTPIEFFRNDRIVRIDSDMINDMNKTDFRKRAFAWRAAATGRRKRRVEPLSLQKRVRSLFTFVIGVTSK